LAGKAANAIIARDVETERNFSKINRHVSLDSDIAWHIADLDLSAYTKDAATLEDRLQITKKTLFITLRRFRPEHANRYTDVVAETLAHNTDKPIVVAILEPQHVDPEGYALLEKWRTLYKNVQVIDFSFNPLALYLFFQKHHKQLTVISPQFHALITAHLTHTAFLPLVYDNKSAEMLRQIGISDQIHIRDISATETQAFINANF
jgi:polysaccharide pyruvyl transferase WcaK-like protein